MKTKHCILLASLFLAGCGSGDNGGFTAGIHGIPKAEPSTAESRQEFEWIPDAQLVRESTMPDWALGRNAFKPGTDRLLVVSNIISAADRPSSQAAEKTKDKSKAPSPVTRSDRWMERVWITVPLTAKPGDVLDIERMQLASLVGYDRGSFKDGRMLIHPSRVRGTLSILELKDNAAVVALVLEVTPNRDLPAWRVDRTIDAPLTRTGIRANAAAVTVAQAPTDKPGSGQPATATNPVPAPSGETPATGLFGESQMARLQGKWIAQTDAFEFRFQFEPDGSMIYCTRLGGGDYPPAMKYGTFKIQHNDRLVLFIKRFEIDGISHIRFLNPPLLLLNLTWDKEQPVLTGDFKDREGNVRITLVRADYPDMAKTVPPKGRGDWTKETANPAPVSAGTAAADPAATAPTPPAVNP